MKRIVATTPLDTAAGFGLAGVRQLSARATELGETVLALARDPATGVVIVDERLTADAAVQQALARIDREWPGLVVVLPAPSAAALEEEDYALRMIRRAIGYQVRITL